jgi:hypothetical protein
VIMVELCRIRKNPTPKWLSWRHILQADVQIVPNTHEFTISLHSPARRACAGPRKRVHIVLRAPPDARAGDHGERPAQHPPAPDASVPTGRASGPNDRPAGCARPNSSSQTSRRSRRIAFARSCEARDLIIPGAPPRSDIDNLRASWWNPRRAPPRIHRSMGVFEMRPDQSVRRDRVRVRAIAARRGSAGAEALSAAVRCRGRRALLRAHRCDGHRAAGPGLAVASLGSAFEVITSLLSSRLRGAIDFHGLASTNAR